MSLQFKINRMTKLISFHTYQTENFNILGNEYSIRFTQSQDKSEYSLLVSNITTSQESKYSYTKEDAENFKRYNNKKLKNTIMEIIKEGSKESVI